MAPRAFLYDSLNKGPLVQPLWLNSKLDGGDALSGIPVEYRVPELFSRDRRSRKADFVFNLSPADQETLPSIQAHHQFDFTCLPTNDVTFGVIDAGRSCTAALIVKNKAGRVYPPQAMMDRIIAALSPRDAAEESILTIHWQ